MAGLITLPTRDMNGIADLNNNFQFLYELVQQANNKKIDLEFHDWTRDGIVMHNGFSLENNSGYRYIQLPTGQKIVELIIMSKLSNDNFHGGEWFTLPDVVKPNSFQVQEPLVGGYYTNQSAANTITLSTTTSDVVRHEDYWVHALHTVYFSN